MYRLSRKSTQKCWLRAEAIVPGSYPDHFCICFAPCPMDLLREENLADSHRSLYVNAFSLFILFSLCIILSLFSLFCVQTVFLTYEVFLRQGVCFSWKLYLPFSLLAGKIYASQSLPVLPTTHTLISFYFNLSLGNYHIL